MPFPARPAAFVLTSTNHGSMIVNRNDQHMLDADRGYGVGFQLLNNSCFDADEVSLALTLLNLRRKYFGDGVVAIDGGANIGVHTIEWSRHMFNWGQVFSFEAQEIVFYALAGNVALNNCLNARVRLAALGEVCGELAVPQPDYYAQGSFGSLEIRQRAETEFIGQKVSYDVADCNIVPMVNIDALGFQRLDFFKLDVEGMELEVFRGAKSTLMSLRPIVLFETIKADRTALEQFFTSIGYRVFPSGINMLAIHSEDPSIKHIAPTEQTASPGPNKEQSSATSATPGASPFQSTGSYWR
ncbi:MAG: FkbM family methyltransferase [Chitinivorax sp.]